MENESLGAGRSIIVDPHGHSTIFFASNSINADGDLGINGVIDMSTLSKDLEPSQFGLEGDRIPDYFYLVPEVDPSAEIGDIGTITVQLSKQIGSEKFVISANQLKASAGSPLSYRVKKVFKTGTDESFSIVW